MNRKESLRIFKDREKEKEESVKAFLKRQGVIFAALIVAVALIILSFAGFVIKVTEDLGNEMQAQTEAILKNSKQLLQNEISTLKRLNETAADFIEQNGKLSDDEILVTLKTYAKKGNIVRTLFVTAEGETYTSYNGYLGIRKDELNGMKLSEIKDTFISEPVYSQELEKAIFGVVTPLSIGEKEGVLVSSYDVEHFRELFQNQFLDGEVRIGIVKGDGEVIFGNGLYNNETPFGKNMFELFRISHTAFKKGSVDSMYEEMSAGKSGFVIYSERDVERYCAFEPADINDWCAIVMVPEGILKVQTAPIEKRGMLLTLNLIIIMAALLCIIITVRHREIKNTNRILLKAATVDGLTRIYNRKTAEDMISDFIQKEGAKGKHAMFLMDIDAFKSINDNFGHISGDTVLRQVAGLLQKFTSEGDILGRMGGDEFVLFYKNYGEKEHIHTKAEQILEAFRKMAKEDEKGMFTSLSIGIATYEAQEQTFGELYQQADRALYRTKEQGKNGYYIYS